ncbi:hypothetical protein ACHHYP_20153 [Achlya hypogyna]|uniref:Initiation factor eIF2 gamma C-terminal domain-containing protein n=1 Tax=Achlya hypogyna TaxID=1202772 RepID=A0A1V9Z2P0_ACHHY|nr:hypothetical protein ACHHYP_20153 [Achlya hypogyna]
MAPLSVSAAGCDTGCLPPITVSIVSSTPQALASFVRSLAGNGCGLRHGPWAHTAVQIYHRDGKFVAWRSHETTETDTAGHSWDVVRRVTFVHDPNQLLPSDAVVALPLASSAKTCAVLWPSSTTEGARLDVASLVAFLAALPSRAIGMALQMYVMQSHDPNRPGAAVENLKGGVAVSLITHGVLRIGDDVELRPGRFVRDHATGRVSCMPLRTRITGLQVSGSPVDSAGPGNLVTVNTTLDATLTRSHRLTGQRMGYVGTLPSIFTEVEVMLAPKTHGRRNRHLAKADAVRVAVGTMVASATVVWAHSDAVALALNTPLCIAPGDPVVMSLRRRNQWQVVGDGVFSRGVKADVADL